MKNVKETVISEFEIDFKKSCLSFSLNSTYTQSENGCGKQHFSVWNRVGIWRTGQHTPPKIPGNPPPPPPGIYKYLREILYLILTEILFQFCGSNYLHTHGTAMGTKMFVAFAHIFMARIENQILSCIEPYPGHQRIFLLCCEMFWIFGRRQNSLEAKPWQKTREK